METPIDLKTAASVFATCLAEQGEPLEVNVRYLGQANNRHAYEVIWNNVPSVTAIADNYTIEYTRTITSQD